MISPNELRRQLADLADRIPPANRDAFEAVERRYRNRRLVRVGAGLSVVAAAVAGGVMAISLGNKTEVVQVGSGQANAGNQSCAIPKLPTPGGSQFPYAGDPLTGPASQDLRDGAVLSSFSLDRGALKVSVPRRDDKPQISKVQAECSALASVTPNGTPLVVLASGSGVAVGYGRVTVSAKLIASAKPDGPFGTGNVTPSSPRLPAASPYDDRLAWVIVVGQARPLLSPGPPRSPVSSQAHDTTEPSVGAGDFNYEVFLVDATTGGAALLYTEPETPIVGRGVTPSVVVPVEQLSVPWTLLSRSLGGYAATISATIQPCDGYPSTINADPNGQSAAAVVYGPVGRPCDGSRQVTMTLHAPTVTAELPAAVAHDPLGPYIAPTSPQSPAQTPGRTFTSLGPQDSRSTILLTIGSVVAVNGLLADQLAVSSNTAVLAPLGGISADQGLSGEFRAVTAGHADLSVPTSACDSTDKTVPPCSGPWVVHVDIP